MKWDEFDFIDLIKEKIENKESLSDQEILRVILILIKEMQERHWD